MKNRMPGFRRLHQDNLGLISARSLQTAECGCGLLLSIWQDQTQVISSNSETVLRIYAKNQGDMVWSRDKWDAYFSSHWSPKLFSCYPFLCLTLRSPMPWFFPPYSLANLIYCLCQRSVKYSGGKGCQQTCLEKLECVWLLLSGFCNCKGTMQ